MGRGDEQKRHFPPGSKAALAAAAPAAAAASLSSRGCCFFYSLSDLGGVAHRRLGESCRAAAFADAQKLKSAPGAKWVEFYQSCKEWTYLSFIIGGVYINQRVLFSFFLSFCLSLCVIL